MPAGPARNVLGVAGRSILVMSISAGTGQAGGAVGATGGQDQAKQPGQSRQAVTFVNLLTVRSNCAR